MKKEYRILDSREFTEIIQHKQFISCGSLVLYYRDRKDKDYCRVGISVTKKLGNAVKRNKAKRQIRDICNKLYKFDEKFDTIIIVRANYDTNSFSENIEVLTKLYNKVKNKA